MGRCYKLMNCIDNECKHLYAYMGELYCSLSNEEIPEDIETGCKFFTHARTCINCKHSKLEIYETGTIDDIEYRCPFQGNKLIYDDLDPYTSHYADVPECNIDKFEQR